MFMSSSQFDTFHRTFDSFAQSSVCHQSGTQRVKTVSPCHPDPEVDVVGGYDSSDVQTEPACSPLPATPLMMGIPVNLSRGSFTDYNIWNTVAAGMWPSAHHDNTITGAAPEYIHARMARTSQVRASRTTINKRKAPVNKRVASEQSGTANNGSNPLHQEVTNVISMSNLGGALADALSSTFCASPAKSMSQRRVPKGKRAPRTKAIMSPVLQGSEKQQHRDAAHILAAMHYSQ